MSLLEATLPRTISPDTFLEFQLELCVMGTHLTLIESSFRRSESEAFRSDFDRFLDRECVVRNVKMDESFELHTVLNIVTHDFGPSHNWSFDGDVATVETPLLRRSFRITRR